MQKKPQQQPQTSISNQNQNQDLTQLHPYQYLSQLNNIYNFCNKANAKSYSSVSKIKLTWKPFSIMKIPNCFQAKFQDQQRCQKIDKDKLIKKKNKKKGNNIQPGEDCMEESQRKIWKEHQEIMMKYGRNREKMESKMIRRPQTSTKSRQAKAQQISVNDQSNQLLKKLKQKGVNITYNKQQLIQQVLQKLKRIQSPPIQNQTQLYSHPQHFYSYRQPQCRAQSAIPYPSQKKQQLSSDLLAVKTKIKQNQQNIPCMTSTPTSPSTITTTATAPTAPPNHNQKQPKPHLHFIQNPYQPKQQKNINENEYLTYDKNSQIVAHYRQRIRQVDCAISEANIRKTNVLLRNMENILEKLQQK